MMVETLCYSSIIPKVKSQNTPDIVFFTVTAESFKFHTEFSITNFVFTSVLIDLKYLFFILKFFMLKPKIKMSFSQPSKHLSKYYTNMYIKNRGCHAPHTSRSAIRERHV
jgi:hypothetical protein